MMKAKSAMLAGVGLLALLAGCGEKKTEAGAPHAAATPAASGVQAMRVTQVEMRPLASGVASTGRLLPREEAAVGAELGGYRVARVMVDEGAWVEAGQPLAQLDDTLLAAQIRQAEAQLAQQEATASFRESSAKRVEGLDKSGALSAEEVQQRKTDAAAARAAVDVSKAQLDEMKTRQARLTLRAPVRGRVLERAIRPGDISAPGGVPYFRISRDGLVELDAEVPDQRLAAIKPGDGATVTLADGKVIAGKVRFISPRVSETTSLGHARISMPYDPTLRPGGFASASFGGASRSASTVIASAVRYEAGGPVVMLVDQGNKLKRVPVKLGERTKDFVELVEGPGPGSTVLAVGSAFSLEGDVIKPLAADAPAAAPAAQPQPEPQATPK